MTDPREALLALLRQADHAPLSTHDPRDGSCQSCPWPLHEMPPEDIADAILLAGWAPPTVKPPVEDVARTLYKQDRAYRGTPWEEALQLAETRPQWKNTVAGFLDSARAVLALFPGRTEAEVKAGELRVAAIYAPGGPRVSGWLRERANQWEEADRG